MATTETALASEVNITLHAGNDVPVTVTVTSSDDVEVNLAAWTSELIVSRNLTPKLTLTSADDDILHYPDTDAIGELVVNFAADDTRELSGVYDYELKVTSPDSDEETAMWGTITFKATADRT